MLRHALAEIRLHPARFISTILAIAISVAFLVGSSVLVASQARAQAAGWNVGISTADVVVETAGEKPFADLIQKVEGVAAVAPSLTTMMPLSHGSQKVLVELHHLLPPGLRWADLAAGRWPGAASEIVLNQGAANNLRLELGDQVTAPDATKLTVVGLTAEPGNSLAQIGYAAPELFAANGIDPVVGQGLWVVKAAAGVEPSDLVERIRTALAEPENEPVVTTGVEARTQAMNDMTRDFEVFKYLLWAFAAIALVVGMITVSNTFAITLAQRRRQIALLRAVGASGAQMRLRYLAEGLVLGVLGGLLGVASGLALGSLAVYLTGAWFWGVVLPVTEIGFGFGVGVFATLAASWFPVLRGTRVHPLEALSPVLDASEQRRVGVVRAVICGLFLAGGSGLVVPALRDPQWGFVYAISAGALISIGVLFGAPLFVPGLLRASGALLQRTGTIPALAARNAQRNPRRATTTATALMLAIGLIVTLQVATSSIRATMLTEVDRVTPVDLAVTWHDGAGQPASLPAGTQRDLGMIAGVSATLALSSARVELESPGYSNLLNAIAWDAGIPVVTGVSDQPGADQVLVSPHLVAELPSKVRVKGVNGARELEVVGSYLAEWGTVVLSDEVLAALSTPVTGSVLWLSVPDRTQTADVLLRVTDLVGSDGVISGSLPVAASMEQVLNLLLGVTTALLAVAVLIALIGVSNTLGLSVLERRRESALLRALGLQARSLRWMLTIEALQVTLIAVLVGLGFGVFFGWLAVSSMAPALRVERVVFSINLPQTVGMLVIAVLAAVLASVGPGRRAARATPTEALADL